jgi:Protein of unknown function (DUF732)
MRKAFIAALAAVGIGAALYGAVPAQAVPDDCHSVPNATTLTCDQGFLYDVHNNGITGGDNQLIATGHQFCDKLHAGETKTQADNDLHAANPNMPNWILFGAAAMAMYCPLFSAQAPSI